MKKIFVIDKDKFRCSFIEFSLKSAGMSVYTLQSTTDSIYFLQDIMPNLLLLDLRTLFLFDGDDFLQQIRENSVLKIQIVGMGTADDNQLMFNNRDLFQAFIQRPLNPNKLVDEINSLLDI